MTPDVIMIQTHAMRFSHTARRCSGVISSFGGPAGFRGGGGRISANDRGGALTEPEGIETEAVSDEARGVMNVVPPEEVAERLTAFGTCSEGLSREPVCCAMGSG